ncbi:hypothetical protein GCM10027580_27980 [Corynebacterium faecale]
MGVSKKVPHPLKPTPTPPTIPTPPTFMQFTTHFPLSHTFTCPLVNHLHATTPKLGWQTEKIVP